MVKRNTVLIIAWSGQSGSTGKSLLHLRPRAGSTVRLWGCASGKVRVTADWGEMSWSSSEIVIKRVMTRRHVIIATGVEGAVRRVGSCAMETRKSLIVGPSRLPVDGLDSVFELGGWSELPFTDCGPDDGDTDNTRSQDRDDGYGRM